MPPSGASVIDYTGKLMENILERVQKFAGEKANSSLESQNAETSRYGRQELSNKIN